MTLAAVRLDGGARVVPALLTAALACWLMRAAPRVDAVDRARALAAPQSRLPQFVGVRFAAALRAADVALDPSAAVQLWCLAVLAAGCLAAGLDLAFAPIAMAAVVVGGPVALHVARHRGARRAATDLPVALEQIAGDLRTGGTVSEALTTLAAGTPGVRPSALHSELERVTRRCALGAPLDDALAAWAAERSDAGVRSAAGALAVAASTGGRAADALDGLASSLRDRLEIAAEARALSAQARLSAIVVGCLPIAYLVGCALLDPRQVGVLVDTTFGVACLLIGLTLEGLAVLWIRVLLREER